MSDLEFSAVVVTYNDEKHLVACLESLSFCRERLVIDLGSTDGCTAVAREHGARVISHTWVPMVELVREDASRGACHEWIIFMDPDMVFPAHLKERIRSEIASDGALGLIHLPYRNYFLGKPIHHGVWGRDKWYPAVIHRARVDFQPSVHSDTRTKPGWKSVRISPENETDLIRHYWIDTWPQFVEKHRRYLALEGESRFQLGTRFSWMKCLFYTSFESFNHLVRKAGYRDGWAGIFLGFLWTWYNWKSWLSLREFEKGLKRA